MIAQFLLEYEETKNREVIGVLADFLEDIGNTEAMVYVKRLRSNPSVNDIVHILIKFGNNREKTIVGKSLNYQVKFYKKVFCNNDMAKELFELGEHNFSFVYSDLMYKLKRTLKKVL